MASEKQCPWHHSLPSHMQETRRRQAERGWGRGGGLARPHLLPQGPCTPTPAHTNLGPLAASPRGTGLPCDQGARTRGQMETCPPPPLSSWGQGRCDLDGRMWVQVVTLTRPAAPTPKAARAEGYKQAPDAALLGGFPHCLLRVMVTHLPDLGQAHCQGHTRGQRNPCMSFERCGQQGGEGKAPRTPQGLPLFPGTWGPGLYSKPSDSIREGTVQVTGNS